MNYVFCPIVGYLVFASGCLVFGECGMSVDGQDQAISRLSSLEKDEKEATRVWGEAVEGQAISIATQESTYTPGEPMTLNVQFKNVGSNDVKALGMAPFDIYKVTVVLPNGKNAPYTLFGKDYLGIPKGDSFSGVILKRGKFNRLKLSCPVFLT